MSKSISVTISGTAADDEQVRRFRETMKIAVQKFNTVEGSSVTMNFNPAEEQAAPAAAE